MVKKMVRFMPFWASVLWAIVNPVIKTGLSLPYVPYEFRWS